MSHSTMSTQGVEASVATSGGMGQRREGAAAVRGLRSEGWLEELLAAFKRGLKRLYGDRLESLYLFGSYARGEAIPDSDVDLAIVLDEVTHYGREIRRTGGLTASLALTYEVSISCVFISSADWRRGEGPFLVNVRTDAIAA